jgi:sugar O-acyltransferase (sialic acid O-acetyltransferase NeuD family)
MKGKIILIGGGGHCKSCIDVIEQQGIFRIAGIVDLPEKLRQNVLGYNIIATDDDLAQLVRENNNFLISTGQIKSPDSRINLYNILKQLGAKLPVIISPLAYVSKHAIIEDGTIIMHHALINAGVKIGKNCIINTRALVEHDAVVEDHCHISTGAVVNGGVKIGSGSFLGSGAVVEQNTSIPTGSFIKANSLYRKSDE